MTCRLAELTDVSCNERCVLEKCVARQRAHRPENDPELTKYVLVVQKLAASLDKVTRERGVLGVADVLANITAATREAEWRCNDIQKGKQNVDRDGVVRGT